MDATALFNTTAPVVVQLAITMSTVNHNLIQKDWLSTVTADAFTFVCTFLSINGGM